MKKIGGNINAVFQTRTVTNNDIGEQVETWTDIQSIKGFLDYMGGQSSYRTYDAKLEESSHIFICDYTQLNFNEFDARAVINGATYEIVKIDNPMELNEHLEIFLKFVGEAQ